MVGHLLGTQLSLVCGEGCVKNLCVRLILVPGRAGWNDVYYDCSSKWAQGRSGAAHIQWRGYQSRTKGANFSPCDALQSVVSWLKGRWMKACMPVGAHKFSCCAAGTVMAG